MSSFEQFLSGFDRIAHRREVAAWEEHAASLKQELVSINDLFLARFIAYLYAMQELGRYDPKMHDWIGVSADRTKSPPGWAEFDRILDEAKKKFATPGDDYLQIQTPGLVEFIREKLSVLTPPGREKVDPDLWPLPRSDSHAEKAVATSDFLCMEERKILRKALDDAIRENFINLGRVHLFQELLAQIAPNHPMLVERTYIEQFMKCMETAYTFTMNEPTALERSVEASGQSHLQWKMPDYTMACNFPKEYLKDIARLPPIPIDPPKNIKVRWVVQNAFFDDGDGIPGDADEIGSPLQRTSDA